MIGIRTVIGLFNMICVIRCSKSQRQIKVTKVQLGGPAILHCVCSQYEFDRGIFHWYKQIIGETPQAIAKFKFGEIEIFEEFNNGHFNVSLNANGTDLSIPETCQTDEAVYYCVVSVNYRTYFRSSKYLILEGKYHHRPDYQTVVQQPVSKPVHPGDSVTLQCSVLSETCPGGHSVYWFRAGSGESHPGVIYIPGNWREECEKRPETPSPTQSCVYSLSKNNLSSSDHGTYYCAVATCGEILFGNGTKLDVETEWNLSETTLVVIILGLSVVLVLCVLVVIFLACTIAKHQSCDRWKVTSSQKDGRDKSRREQSDSQDEDMLNYAALNFSEKRTQRGRKKRGAPPPQESVYSDVRC